MIDLSGSFNVENAFLGRTRDGSRVYISFGIRHNAVVSKNGGYTRPYFSVSGLVVPKYCRNANQAGQIDMSIKASSFNQIAKGMTLQDVRHIWRLWEQYHLLDAINIVDERDLALIEEIVLKLREQPTYEGNWP